MTNYLETGGTLTPGAPWSRCITTPPRQVMDVDDAFPGRT